MEQGFSCSTLALQNTDILEELRRKKNRCNLQLASSRVWTRYNLANFLTNKFLNNICIL